MVIVRVGKRCGGECGEQTGDDRDLEFHDVYSVGGEVDSDRLRR